ncbi:hypothetical protein ACVNHC_18865 [Pannonibacter sp. Q-1]
MLTMGVSVPDRGSPDAALPLSKLTPKPTPKPEPELELELEKAELF